MVDITMCSGGDCPSKDVCYRYTATPNPYMQAYFVDPPYLTSKDPEGCDAFVLTFARGVSMKDVYEQVDADYAGVEG